MGVPIGTALGQLAVTSAGQAPPSSFGVFLHRNASAGVCVCSNPSCVQLPARGVNPVMSKSCVV